MSAPASQALLCPAVNAAAALVLASAEESVGFDGGAFYIYDIGPGDTWRIGTSVYAEADGDRYRVESKLPAEVMERTG